LCTTCIGYAREFDAFIATIAEYNHGPTAVLKNAFDSVPRMATQAHRPLLATVASVRRAVETLRGVVIELQMAPIRHEVNLAMEPLIAGKPAAR